MLPGGGWLLSLVRTISSFPCCVPGFLFSAVAPCQGWLVMGLVFLPNWGSLPPRRPPITVNMVSGCCYFGGRGLSLVRPSFSSIGEAMTLCSDGEGDSGEWLNLSTCPCTSYTYGSGADLKGPINHFLVETNLRVGLFTLLEEVELLTVPVNKKFTFRFKKTIVLRLTVLSKHGTTVERKRNGHTIWKQNGTYTKTERNILRTVYTWSVKKRQRSSFRVSVAVSSEHSSFRVSVAVFEWARLFKTSEQRSCQYRLSEAVSKLV